MSLFRELLVATLTCIALISLFTHASTSSNSQTHALDTSLYYFQLNNNARIKFDSSLIYFGDVNGLWVWLDDNGIRFYNLRMGDSECPSAWHIYATTQTNLTIQLLFENDKLLFTVASSESANSTVEIYCGVFGQPVSITPSNINGGYDSVSRIQTVIVNQSSVQPVIIDWATTAGFSAVWLMYGLTVGLIFGIMVIAYLRRNGSVVADRA